MSNLAEYFYRNRYKPKFFIGDRVFGHWNKIPFIGTVGNDGLVSESEGPKVSIFLDLPILYQGQVKKIIVVKPKDIKKLTNF